MKRMLLPTSLSILGPLIPIVLSALGPQVVVPVSVPQPGYPPIANAARVWGDVVIKVGVRPDGTVASAAVESGVPLLQDVALKAAQQAQFECRDCVEPATAYSLVFAFRFPGQDKSDLPAGLNTTPDGHATMIILGKVGYWFEGAVFSTIGVRVRAAKCLWLWKCGVKPVSR